MAFYFDAKAELNSEAVDGGAIPWSAVLLYAETYGLDVEEFDQLLSNIRAMERGISRENDKAQKRQHVKEDDKKQ